MRQSIFSCLLLMILFGVSGCGKEDQPVQEGVNPMDERAKGYKDSNRDRGPMFPKGTKPGAPKNGSK